MPIYDYECQDCGQVSEVFLRSADSENTICPGCGGKNLKRLISASYVIGKASSEPGATCCGRTERCEAPPCSVGGACRRG